MSLKNKSIFKELYYQPYRREATKFHDYAKDNLDFVQRLGLIQTLPLHQGCVNTLCWNEAGNLLLSGSDDQHLVVTNAHTYQVVANYRTSHRANIFSAKFLPQSADRNIVSCSGDGIILYTDLERPMETYYNQFNCHSGTTYEVITIPHDPFTFLSCGEDGTVRWFDLRVKERCKKLRCKEDILISHHRAVSALCINPLRTHELAIGSSDSTVRIFDRRMLTVAEDTENDKRTHHPITTFTVPELEERTYRITSLSYSPDGKDMLVSYSSDHLYLFSTQEPVHVEVKNENSECKKGASVKRLRRSPPPVRRLRLRGDWSDTGPDARPERDVNQAVSIGQARPQLQATLMERMTNVLFRMLNDPLTRAALSAGGEDSLETNSSQHSQQQVQVSTQTDEQNEEHIEDVTENHELEDHEESMVEESSDDTIDTSSDSSRSTLASNDTRQTETKNEETQTERMFIDQPVPQQSNSTVNSEFTSLRDQLSTLREGFIEKHGSEPSVSLHYSEQSSTNSTIKIGVSDELNRSYVPPCSSQSLPNDAVSKNETSDVQDPLVDEVNENVTEEGDPADVDDIIGSLGDVGQERTEDDRDNEVQVDYTDSEDEPNIINRNIHVNCNTKVYQPQVTHKYVGHRNARTMIKEATFWGNDYVMSGSDCGHVFIWDRHTAELVMLLQADHHVVNCIQPHPTLPLLATSGIDHDIKMWAPVLEETNFDLKMAQDLMKRNEVMLEETRDTITVPAAFMIRMLACLNQIRRNGSLRQRRRDDPEPDQNSS